MIDIAIPGSKSVTHRAYVLAAQSDAPVTVVNPLRAADPDATLACLHAMGARFDAGDAVTFQPAELRPARLDCRNAGTALRLLTPLAARFGIPSILDGDASLRQRPNAPLLRALATLGATATADRCPFEIVGPIHAGHTQVSGNSSQYASGLLLTLPMLDGPSTLEVLPPVRSRPYLDVTLDTAAAFGLTIRRSGDAFAMPGAEVPRADSFVVEADWSTAAFFLVAAAMTGQAVRCQGLDSTSRQADRAIVALLRATGVEVRDGVVRGAPGPGLGTVDVAANPDLFPILCILATQLEGPTTFVGGESLRDKESDRIQAMARGLQAMGIEVREHPDGLTVQPGQLQGAKVDARDDHRIHMAFRVAALVARGATDVSHPESVAISHPNFHADLAMLEAA